ncbi:MAG: D-cysteine desulfhydrase family protein [Clostridia bacterium]|nr:D-cysteine desulfhydrase family protein [Clostridia bacterium]
MPRRPDVKRDDQTGSEVSGNKVRKLEFAVQEALDQNCDTLITCGGIQSNHARATAAVAAKLGMSSYLVLNSQGQEDIDGNYFLDRLFGANIRLITPKEFEENRMGIMEDIQEKLAKENKKAYIIPLGASNGIGTFGYFKAMDEIIVQEKEMQIQFDAICISVGSGGTYAGLSLASKLLNHQAKIYGFNVSSDAVYFRNQIEAILYEACDYLDCSVEIDKSDIHIIDGYVGKGYAVSQPHELEFIKEIAQLEGFILDPVYTGKGFYGMVNEIKKGTLSHHKNILFIHTGGMFGVFPQKNLFSFE